VDTDWKVVIHDQGADTAPWAVFINNSKQYSIQGRFTHRSGQTSCCFLCLRTAITNRRLPIGGVISEAIVFALRTAEM
jgi:hypothetical protein